jgi:excinuclease ABC subunit C
MPQEELRSLAAGRSSTEALLTRLQKRLGVGRVPRRIECFDNSNLAGTAAVAGMVVFVDGEPAPSAYRRYRIRTRQRPR